MKSFPNLNEQMDLIRTGTEEIIPEEELVKKIERSIREKEPLKVKCGCDPSRPDLHIGHSVVLRKLRDFQDLGHTATLLIGDFTAMIGDPTGRNKTRPQLSIEEARENADSYVSQASLILDSSSIKIMYNGDWLSKMNFNEIIILTSKYTVARMLERDDFTKRYNKGAPISLHEFLYPLAQGYDSVYMKADVELGGTDQKFNLLLGREVQKHYGTDQQAIFTVPLLEGLDGVRKMSKSLNNYIALEDQPDEMFGKIMSISDDLMWRYFSLLSFKSSEEISNLKEEIKEGANPRDIKFLLAEEIVERFNSGRGSKSKENFINRFQKGNISQELDEINFEIAENSELLTRVLKESELLKSTSDAIRMIKQGAIKVNDERVSDSKFSLKKGSSNLVLVGKKKAARINIK